jgi:hypothetical protein
MSASRGSAAQKAAPVFAALADATRLGLVRRLSTEGPLSITRLSDGSGMTRQAITRDTWEGRERVFSLDLKRLEIAQQYLEDVSAHWDAAAARLKAFVEKDKG